VTVVGAGVAGIATALALRTLEVDVTVFERSPDVRRTGGALLLWTNALRVLRALGLAEAVLDRGTVLDVTEFRSWGGDTLWSLPVRALGNRHGAPSVVITRVELLEILLGALGPDALRLDAELTDFADLGDAVAARFRGGGEAHADALVGADGIRSRVREALIGPEDPAPTGQVAWVGIAAFEDLLVPAGVALATAGDGLRFWCAGMKRGLAYWYATVRESDGVRSLVDLERLFCSAHVPIRDLIAATHPRHVVVTAIQDRPPRRGWSRGRVLITGDAAHASTPDLGQGACQGLESAIVLAAHWEAAATIEEAFDGFEYQRFPRCSRITALSRATAEASGIRAVDGASLLRDFGVQTHLPWVALREFDEMFGMP
jgi:2-polyprenyl-6-methoxyphenol hydroxylase-like FAD-dependent oxidoreductase